jgi:hypothetical protein
MQTKRRELFTTVRTEGAILPADLLQRIVDGDSNLEGLKPEDFHRAGERLNEVINGAWNRLLGQWQTFQAALNKLPESDIATSVTRERWLLPLFRELDYGRLPTTSAIEVNGKSYPISHGWQKAPIHLVGWRIELDRRTAGVAGAARTSPHSLVQECLNQSDDHLWAFVSNGQRLRILRDNISLTRQAFVEFDLEAMMDGEVYADFALLWLLCHQSRVEGDRPEQCWLEKWSRTAQDTGTRALDTLRQGVEEAIKALGRGFLANPANSVLKDKLRQGGQKGGLSTQEYYRQVLRIVYRLLFLFVAEDRNVLLLSDADEKTRKNYARFYSTARLRHLAERHRGTRHCDLFQGLAMTMERLGTPGGCPELGLPALGSFLWSNRAAADLLGCRTTNTDFLAAIRALAFTIDEGVLRPVDYRNLGAEELGSVYESLLELHPKLNADAGTFELDVAAGHERKTTGSYYTRTSLVECVLDTALNPTLDEVAKKPTAKEAEAAILNFKFCDPACGSGHFLIAAARRVAKRLAAIRTGDAEPAPEALRQSLRDVIGRCVFGVDLNPMAVELCKVNLWLESLDPGMPLSFLDHHIQCGNSLLGTTPALLNEGIPDDAFTPIEGDDKKLCTEYKKQNRDERRGQKRFKFEGAGKPWERMGDFAVSLATLEQVGDDSLEGVRTKEERYAQLVGSADYLSGRFWADAWSASFVWKKTREFDYAVTEELFRRIERNPHDCTPWMRAEIQRLAQQYQFFHWHLAYPQVFQVPTGKNAPENRLTGWSGGFDVVLGNPPWERIKLQEKEWFAECRPDIANAPNAAARRKMIAALEHEDPALSKAFLEDRRQAEGESTLVRATGRYPLCGRGDINTYAIFAELKKSLISSTGRVGCIVPSGVASDDTTRYFFQDLVDSFSISSLFDFENAEGLFPAVHREQKFSLLTLTGKSRPAKSGADFVFFAHDPSEVLQSERRFRLSAKDIALVNPNTRTCPIFRSKADALLTKRIYERVPVLIREGSDGRPDDNPWSIRLFTMFHMTNDSHLFRTVEQLQSAGGTQHGNAFSVHREEYVPLFEGKLTYCFDHRASTFADVMQEDVAKGNPRQVTEQEHGDPNIFSIARFWIAEQECHHLLADPSSVPAFWLSFHGIANPNNERTFIATIIPPVAAGNSLPLLANDGDILTGPLACCLVANLNAFVLDYVSRLKISSRNFNFFVVKQLPVLGPDAYQAACPWDTSVPDVEAWIRPRSLELSYTAWDLQPLARECHYDGAPFIWNEQRRFLLRSELDAAFLHLYGVDRQDAEYIMDTFPLIRRRDEEEHGEFRTKRTILEVFDQMSEAIRRGRPYQTPLGPSPAATAVAHPPKR